MRYTRTIFALIFVLLNACGMPESDNPSYGLPLVELSISSDSLGTLQNERAVSSELRLDKGTAFTCAVSYAAQSNPRDYRKSYSLRKCMDTGGDSLNAFRLEAQNKDKTKLRSTLGLPIFEAAGLKVPTVQPSTVFVNNDYFGTYLKTDALDASFFESRGIAATEVYRAKAGKGGFKPEFASQLAEAFPQEGDDEGNYAAIKGIYEVLARKGNEAEIRDLLARRIDVEAFLAYAATTLFLGHDEGFEGGYYLVATTGDGRLTIVPWSLDRIWGQPNTSPESMIARNDLISRMLEIPEFRAIFLQKLQALLAAFPPSVIEERLASEKTKLEEAYAHDATSSEAEVEALQSSINAWYEEVKRFSEAFSTSVTSR